MPYRYLFPAIIVFCCIGVYSLRNSMMEVVFMAVAGVAGYVLRKLGCEPAPLLLGLILGPMLEENFRRSLAVSGGDYMIFLQRPISATLLAAAVLLLVFVLLPGVRRQRELLRE